MQRIFGKLCRKHTRIQFEPVNRVQPFHCGHNHFWHRLSIWTGTNKSYYLYMHALHSHPAIMAVSLAPQTIVLFISSFIPYMYIYIVQLQFDQNANSQPIGNAECILSTGVDAPMLLVPPACVHQPHSKQRTPRHFPQNLSFQWLIYNNINCETRVRMYSEIN